MSGSTDNGGEDGTRGVISSESGFAHSGSIVHNKGGYVIVTHFASASLHKLETFGEIRGVCLWLE
jgi:hypothetical protein